MKILNFSLLYISKCKRNYIISPSRKFSIYLNKSNIQPLAFRGHFRTILPLLSVTSRTLNSISHKDKGGKIFQEKENEYAHQVMENLSYYSNSLLKFAMEHDSYTTDKFKESTNLSAIEKFIQVTLLNFSKGLNLENKEFTSMVQSVCALLPAASHEDVKKTLYYLCLWPPTSHPTTENFKLLWNTLDQECVKRIKHWNVSEKLLIGDYWFHLKLSRITQYNSALIYQLTQDIESLSNPQLVQLMFFINLQRTIPETFLCSVEKKLESIIKSVTLEELGIICLGFFKTQNAISNVNLTESIIKRFMHNVENLNTVTISAILKFLRKSRNFALNDLYILTLHKCVSCLDNFDIPTSVHLALLASECNVYHPLLLNCVSEKLSENMKTVRIKDCAKFLLCLSLYNHFEGSFRESFFAEVKRDERQCELISYPIHVIHSALYFCYGGYYDYDFLAKIFNRGFKEETCSRYPDMRTTYAEIDYCIEIECPDYRGPKLESSERKVLLGRRGGLSPAPKNPNMNTRLRNDVYGSLVKIFGSDKNILLRHVLPHIYSPDIIVRLSGNNEVSLKKLCQDISEDVVLKPLPGEVWAAFVACGTYSFAHKSTKITGGTAMKLRQLEKIGYHVVFLPYYNISRNSSQREAFLKEKLSVLEKEIKTVAF